MCLGVYIMGGNALVEVETKRLSKEDFVHATEKVVRVLNSVIKDANASGLVNITHKPHEVKAYREKETFGDLDLLVDEQLFEVYTYEQLLIDMAKEFDFVGDLPFKPKEPKDMVFSFGVPDVNEPGVFFQIDLIATKAKYFDFHASYLNWNDLGNLIGVVASKTRFLKYGHDGLKYYFHDGDHQFDEVVLTTDWNEALVFLGYDPERYKAGFDTLIDIYEYAGSSKYFNPELYAFEQRNHVQRTRDRKRPTYNGFLKWIEENEASGLFDNTYKKTPDEWKDEVVKVFPWFPAYEVQSWKNLENAKVLKQFFNGSQVLKLKPHLVKEEISLYMKKLKELEPDLMNFVLKHKENSVRLLIERLES